MLFNIINNNSSFAPMLNFHCYIEQHWNLQAFPINLEYVLSVAIFNYNHEYN